MLFLAQEQEFFVQNMLLSPRPTHHKSHWNLQPSIGSYHSADSYICATPCTLLKWP